MSQYQVTKAWGQTSVKKSISKERAHARTHAQKKAWRPSHKGYKKESRGIHYSLSRPNLAQFEVASQKKFTCWCGTLQTLHRHSQAERLRQKTLRAQLAPHSVKQTLLWVRHIKKRNFTVSSKWGMAHFRVSKKGWLASNQQTSQSCARPLILQKHIVQSNCDWDSPLLKFPRCHAPFKNWPTAFCKLATASALELLHNSGQSRAVKSNGLISLYSARGLKLVTLV